MRYSRICVFCTGWSEFVHIAVLSHEFEWPCRWSSRLSRAFCRCFLRHDWGNPHVDIYGFVRCGGNGRNFGGALSSGNTWAWVTMLSRWYGAMELVEGFLLVFPSSWSADIWRGTRFKVSDFPLEWRDDLEFCVVDIKKHTDAIPYQGFRRWHSWIVTTKMIS